MKVYNISFKTKCGRSYDLKGLTSVKLRQRFNAIWGYKFKKAEDVLYQLINNNNIVASSLQINLGNAIHLNKIHEF